MVVDYQEVEFIPPDEQSVVVAKRSVEFSFDSTDFTADSEWSTYLSSVRWLILGLVLYLFVKVTV